MKKTIKKEKKPQIVEIHIYIHQNNLPNFTPNYQPYPNQFPTNPGPFNIPSTSGPVAC